MCNTTSLWQMEADHRPAQNASLWQMEADVFCPAGPPVTSSCNDIHRRGTTQIIQINNIKDKQLLLSIHNLNNVCRERKKQHFIYSYFYKQSYSHLESCESALMIRWLGIRDRPVRIFWLDISSAVQLDFGASVSVASINLVCCNFFGTTWYMLSFPWKFFHD